MKKAFGIFFNFSLSFATQTQNAQPKPKCERSKNRRSPDRL